MALWFGSLIFGLLTLGGLALEYQQPLEAEGHVHSELRVAIIGAGIAGASAAYNLHELTRQSNPATISIYEKESQPGGRIRSFLPGTEFHRVLEDGATHFLTSDSCLISAAKDVGLRLDDARDSRQLPRSISMWANSGRARTEVICDVESLSYWDLIRLIWRYGRSFITFRDLVSGTAKGWDAFAGVRPFDNIRDELTSAGLNYYVTAPAPAYYDNLSTSAAYRREIIQACSRARALQSLEESRGLSSLLTGRAARKTSIDGGNSRLVERLIRLSEADLHLSSEVTAITLGHSRRYKLAVSSLPSGQEPQVQYAEFDAVVLAAPLHGSGIAFTETELQSARTTATHFSEAHVTHFTTAAALSSNLSECPLDVHVSDNDLLTTSASAQDANIINLQESTVCYRRGCLPGDDCDQCDYERLYRVQSTQHMTDGDILKLIGVTHVSDERSDPTSHGITWVHRRAWPHAFPGPPHESAELLQRIEIAPQLYYLGGAEEIMSSLEMSCRMGRNAARKLYWHRSV